MEGARGRESSALYVTSVAAALPEPGFQHSAGCFCAALAFNGGGLRLLFFLKFTGLLKLNNK